MASGDQVFWLTNWGKVVIGLIVVVAPMIAGGFVAQWKKDFFSRGMMISLLSSWFGPMFMIFCQPSRARQDDPDDMQSWPSTGPMASLCFLGACILIYLIAKLF